MLVIFPIAGQLIIKSKGKVKVNHGETIVTGNKSNKNKLQCISNNDIEKI